MTAETWQPPACKVPDLSIWPAGGAPSRARTQKPLVTGDQDFDRAVTVYARDPLYLGVLSDEPLENLKELVVTHGVTCENGRFAVETARLGLIERMDLEYIAEMFDSPRDVLERWLRYDALAHSNPTVRRLRRRVLDDLVSRAEIVHELDAVETERALRADADLVMDTSLPVERKVPSLERLMAGLSANAWRFVAGEIGATDLALSRQALFPRWHRVLRSTDTVAHHDLEALCCAVSAEPPAPPMPVQMALAICALIPRVDEPALAVAGEIGCWLSEHPDDAVVSALLDVAYAIDPTLGDLVWLDFDFLPDPLAARAQGLGEGRAFGPRLNELLKLALDGQVERLTSHSTPDRRRRILELLRDLGLPEHIPVLAPLARWWLRPSDEKTLAREAIAAIKDRFRHRAGGLSLAAPAKGGLSVPAPETPPQRPAGARGLRAKALRAQSAEAKSRISRP